MRSLCALSHSSTVSYPFTVSRELPLRLLLVGPFLALMGEVTDLIVVELGMSSFDERIMVLLMKD